jgi:hypothetical protein
LMEDGRNPEGLPHRAMSPALEIYKKKACSSITT